MRKLYPGYETFLKEQKPKYEQTFLEWYEANCKIGEVNLLSELQKKNHFCVQTEWNGFFSVDKEHVTCFKDFFSKKLQLCENLLHSFMNQPVTYDLGIAADIMDLYEDVIQEVCVKDNIYVTMLPSGKASTFAYATESHTFQNLEALKEEFSTGIVIVYMFTIRDDSSILIRYHKREPLTRKVLVEKE